MTQNVGDIEYVIKADTSQLLRADKEVNDATSGMESGFKRTDKAAEKTGKAIVRAADDASDAAKIIERLGNEIAILEEANEGGAKSASIFAAQLAASGDASQKQKEEIGALAGKLYDLRAAVKEAAKASSESAKQSSKQASEAERLRSITQSLSKQIAVLKEEQRNGARSAAMLSARLQAGSNATAAQRREIGELAGKLYDLKNAQDQASRSSSGLKAGLTAIASAITISQLVRYGKQFLEVADAMMQLQARIDRLSPSAEEGRKTFSALAEMASVSGTSLADTEKLWETLTSSLQSAGASNGQILQLTDTLQKIGKIGGSSTQEMANALRQFGQSIASGTVRAQEFNSIVEQMPELARQIAAGMGISMDELRRLMLDGKLSAEDSLNAIIRQTNRVNDQFNKLPRSVEQATNSMSISFQMLVGEINDTTNASTTMVSVIDSITASIERLSGKVPNAIQQIAELRSEAEMYARRARTWGWLGFGEWQKENEEKSAKLTAEAWEKSSRTGWEAAQKVAKNSKPIEIKTESAEDNTGGKQKTGDKADSATQALLRQQAALDRLNTGYADGSLELAKYDAVVALGNKASAEQIAKAEQQAESIWKVQQATKAAAEEERKRTQAGQNFTGLQGQVSPVAAVDNTYAQQMAQLDEYVQLYPQKIAEAEAVRAGIEDQYHQKRMAAMWEEWQQQSEINNMLGAAIDSLQGGATSAITGLINGTQSLQESFANIGTTILNSVVGSLVQMGIEWVKSQLMGQAAAAASLASTMAQATAAASAWAPAAISASIATMGSAAAVGQTAYAGSLLAAKGMAVAGARYNGGPVDAGSLYRVGEKGKPEIFQASNGSQYMIPGDNGRVISNKDVLGGGGGGASFNPVMNLTINTTGGIGSEDIARLRKAWSNDMLKMMVDQSTRPGGLLQGRKK
ncbi:tape measure protein [Enterobacter hormaechei]|uniref:tape measure protein n=1 Tax=Enterobacter hormaechei TaxID=158836 RepID=UPI003A5990AD